MISVKQIDYIVRRPGRTNRRATILKRLGLGLFLVLVIFTPILYTRVGGNARVVYAAASKELNFQARLLTGSGAIAPDGNYSIQFNLYSVASGGSTQWTETQGTVAVRSGYVSVYLGSVTAFPGTVDWSQQQWLTMNVNGDGEMTPRLKLTAVPNALHANEADALRSGSNLLTADNFAQLAPSSPQVINSALAALRLNQTGAGLLAQLQHNGADVLTIANNGDLTTSGSATFSGGSLTLGTATQIGGLVLKDGAGKKGTVQTTTLGADQTYTFPNASGTVCLTTTCGGAANAFINGGNLFGSAAALGTNDGFALNFRTSNTNQLTLDTSGNLNFLNGGLQIGGTSVLTSGRVLQNVTADTSILTSGTLGAARGGTGLNSYAVGDLLYASGTTALSSLSDVASGNVLLSGGIGTVPTWGKVTLGTHTTGSYVANLGTLTGLTTTGNSGAGSTPTLSVAYGAAANTAVQGNTTLICPSGTGNLSGTGNTITLGTGGTCTALDTQAAVTFVTSVTTPIVTNAGALTVSTTGSNDLTLTSGSGLLVLNTSTLRRTAAGGTTFDLVDGANTTLNFTNSGAGNLNISADGTVTAGGGLVVTSGGASITGNTSVASGTFTSSGGLISLNDASNFGTKINTGSSNGTVTIGGGSAALVIDSTAFDVSSTGALSGITTIVTSSTINTNTFTGTNLTFGGASGAISTTSNGNLTIGPAGSGVLALNTGSGGTLTTNASTIQRSGATGLSLDLANAGTTTLTVTNSDASNVANLSVEGGITAGTNSAFSVNTDGDVTGVARQLDGSSTANGASAGGLGSATSLTLTSAANFDVGNYVRVTSANCGGTGINPCYAKITAKATNTLTIAPALTWANASAVVEFHFPEIGGVDTSQSLANRYGRGYFISGVATGNGTTFYNEDSVTSTLANFDFLRGVTGTLSIGVGANTITLGGSGTTTTFAGNVSFTGTVSGIGPNTGTSGYLQRNGTIISPATGGDSFTTSGNISTSGSGVIMAANGLTVQGGGASITGGLTLATGVLNLTSGGITNTGSIVGATTISASGAITAATISNTINGLVISSGALSSITGITFTSGSLNLSNGGITNAGSIAGASTISLSGAITGATSINTINGLIINSGTLSGITGMTFTSGSLNLNNGGLTNGGAFSGLTTLGLSGAITGATATNTINGLVINSGALSSITNIILSGTISGGTTITGTTLNGTTGINTGAGAGTQRIDTSGNLVNIASLSLTGSANGLTYMSFNTAGANPIYQEGRLFYDNTQKALSYYNSEAAVTLNIGQENYIYVYNNTASTINDGQAVYINGSNGGVPTIALARADALATAQIVGVATHSVEAGTFGFVTNFGEVNNLNTSGFTAGDTLYVSATTAGLLTNVRPAQPNFTSPAGRVANVNATTGKIMVIIGNTRFGGYTAGRLAFGGSDGDIKEDSNLVWDNTNKRLGIGGTPAQALDVVGNIQASSRFYVPGTSGTNGQGFFTGTATTSLGGFQSLDLGGNTYSFLGNNKSYNGTAWVDNGLGRLGSSFQIQNDAFTFYSFNTGTTFTPRFTVASGGNVGIGTAAAAPQAVLHVASNATTYTTYTDIGGTTATLGASFLEQTVTDSSFTNPYRGAVNKTLVNFASDPGAKSILGGYNEVGTPSGNATAMASATLRATNNAVTHGGTGTVGTGAGLVTVVRNMSTGTITNAISLQGQIQNNSTGTIGTSYGLQISDLVNTGTITTTYGIYVGDVTTGTQTNQAYSLYAVDANALNYFAGNVGIGDATPLATLTVGNGDLFQVAGATGNVTTAGDVAVNGGDVTSTGALKLTSGGGLDLTLDSGSNKIVIAGTDSIIQRNSAGTTTLDLLNAGSATSLIISNSDATQVANLNVEGIYQAGGTSGLTIAACTAGQYLGNGVATKGGIITAGTCRNDATGLSDVRLKKDINSVGSVLDKLAGVNVVTFDFKVDEFPDLNLDHGLQYGVIAQELEQIFPELVATRDDGYKEVNFKGLSFYTLKAVTELAAKIDAINGTAGANEVKTDGVLRLSHDGVLQNITGFNIISGGATIAGGINNNGGGITNVGAVLGATTISAQGLVLNANSSDNLLTLSKDNQGVFTVFNNGALGLQTDATNAFSVKNAAGVSVFAIDTKNGKVTLGSGDTAKTVLFILDSRSTVDDPKGANGASYYNAAAGRFRCYQDNRWQDCLPAGDLTTSIAADKVNWLQPSGDQEFPGTPRIVASLTRAHEFRLSMRLTSSAAANASCRLQYAASDNGPWADLSSASGHDLIIDQTGTLKSDWLKIAEGARANNDTVIRVMCKGGDSIQATAFYGVTMQLR